MDHEKHYSKQDDIVDEKCAKNNENHKDNLKQKNDQKMTVSTFFKKNIYYYQHEDYPLDFSLPRK